MKYVIEFRSGSFFTDLESEHGCSLADAKRFDTKREANLFMKQHEWILFNGGMAKPE